MGKKETRESTNEVTPFILSPKLKFNFQVEALVKSAKEWTEITEGRDIFFHPDYYYLVFEIRINNRNPFYLYPKRLGKIRKKIAQDTKAELEQCWAYTSRHIEELLIESISNLIEESFIGTSCESEKEKLAGIEEIASGILATKGTKSPKEIIFKIKSVLHLNLSIGSEVL